MEFTFLSKNIILFSNEKASVTHRNDWPEFRLYSGKTKGSAHSSSAARSASGKLIILSSNSRLQHFLSITVMLSDVNPTIVFSSILLVKVFQNSIAKSLILSVSSLNNSLFLKSAAKLRTFLSGWIPLQGCEGGFAFAPIQPLFLDTATYHSRPKSPQDILVILHHKE